MDVINTQKYRSKFDFQSQRKKNESKTLSTSAPHTHTNWFTDLPIYCLVDNGWCWLCAIFKVFAE